MSRWLVVGNVTSSNLSALLGNSSPLRRQVWPREALSPSVTMVTFELTAENNGTLLHLIHAGIGEGENWDRYYNARNSGWSIHLKNLTAWLETGTEKTW